MSVTLILGGARSGKSRRCQVLAEQAKKPVLYVATAPMIEGDAEWTARIERHRQERPQHWRLIEEPLALAELLDAEASSDVVVMVDCLTLWLSNVLYADRDAEAETARLCRALRNAQGEVLLVSNEVGLGLVPESPLGRSFRDAQGRLNQAVAELADKVEFVAAGLPLLLKGENQ